MNGTIKRVIDYILSGILEESSKNKLEKEEEEPENILDEIIKENKEIFDELADN